jgi:hypothetical protein
VRVWRGRKPIASSWDGPEPPQVGSPRRSNCGRENCPSVRSESAWGSAVRGRTSWRMRRDDCFVG